MVQRLQLEVISKPETRVSRLEFRDEKERDREGVETGKGSEKESQEEGKLNIARIGKPAASINFPQVTSIIESRSGVGKDREKDKRGISSCYVTPYLAAIMALQ